MKIAVASRQTDAPDTERTTAPQQLDQREDNVQFHQLPSPAPGSTQPLEIEADVTVLLADGGPGMLLTPDNATPVAVGDVFPPGAIHTQLLMLVVPDQQDLFV